MIFNKKYLLLAVILTPFTLYLLLGLEDGEGVEPLSIADKLHQNKQNHNESMPDIAPPKFTVNRLDKEPEQEIVEPLSIDDLTEVDELPRASEVFHIEADDWETISEGRMGDPNDDLKLTRIQSHIKTTSMHRQMKGIYPTACRPRLTRACGYTLATRDEEVDLAWRYAMEETLHQLISLSRQPEGFRIQAIRCKQLVCEVLVFYPPWDTPPDISKYDLHLYSYLLNSGELNNIRTDVRVFKSLLGHDSEDERGDYQYFVITFYDNVN